jgi:hypothetical protein
MDPTHKADVRLSDGTEVYGYVMYLIVWEGKALSGEERLIRGDEIASIEISEEN